MKLFIGAGIALVAIIVAFIIFGGPAAMAPSEEVTQEGLSESPENPLVSEKLKADTFTGTLEEVNTGCFSDGECYVMVDGKHVTVLQGWSQDTVGNIVGAPSIGDLENYIGSEVEVYAQVNPDNTYTLYGSEGFYVKASDKGGNAPPPSEAPITANRCVVGGCSGQLCVDESQGDMPTTCEYREVYACYQTATCARQATGQCGWTETAELKACIASKE